MIVYVSPAEINGGILQFSTAITRETRKLMSCKLFLPTVVDPRFYEDIFQDVVTYKKIKTLNKKNEDIMKIAKQIIDLSPKIVIFVEDSLLMQEINEILYNYGIKTAMVIHDVKHHVYRNMGIRKSLVDIIRRRMMRRTSKLCSRIILLSYHSEKMFQKEYKKDNTFVFPLPAHIPNALPGVPDEIKDMEEEYFLFFGRIDEYKGIENLCKVYLAQPDDFKKNNKLIIAGKGQLSMQESNMINEESDIILINRFIEDSEMIWLFENAKAVVLPYIEATQSGVLPIAYKFGKPVVVSDLHGLIENVLHRKTGYIFKTTEELSECLLKFNDFDFSKHYIENYYINNYSWENNLKLLFDVLIKKESER